MELIQIKYFLELAKREHVSATADFLEISQPALSKSIMSLEKEIGVKLFDRKGKRIYLNQHGRYFLNYAQRALEDLNKGIVSAQHSLCAGRHSSVDHLDPDLVCHCALMATRSGWLLLCQPLVLFLCYNAGDEVVKQGSFPCPKSLEKSWTQRLFSSVSPVTSPKTKRS